MKRMTNVKLVNWHTFPNEDIPIYKNTLMTGENGVGKTTAVDAIQYILTAGRGKFNKAAVGASTRSVESYMRCKMGKENEVYLRNGQITSYIALEFYDEKKAQYQILGVVFELEDNGKPDKQFYQIINSRIHEIKFVDKHKALTKSEFKDNLVNKNVIFKEKRVDVEKLFANALGVDPKYFELVSKALSFTSIDNVYQFIVDFLLKEDSVQIDSLCQSVKHYQRLEETLSLCEIECNELEGIVERYQDYEKKQEFLRQLEFSKNKISEKSLKAKIDITKNEDIQLNKELQNKEVLLSQLDEELTLLNKERNSIENALLENNAYQLKNDLMKAVEKIRFEINEKQPLYNVLNSRIEQEQKLWKKIHMPSSLSNLDRPLNSDQMDSKFEAISKYINTRKEEVFEELVSIRKVIEEEEKNNTSFKVTDSFFKNNQFRYSKQVSDLIELLKDELFKHYGREVEVKPVCEYMDVKDERWRNALEGYLNKNKFNLVVEPEYYDFAIRIYNKYKDSKKIYGVGIVDVGRLKKYENDCVTGSLAEMVECKNTYVQWYINMLLGNVICVDDVIGLRNHKIAITQNCMLYKNYVTSAIDPRLYVKPFIGLKALKLQKENLAIQWENCKKHLSELKTSEAELRDMQILLRESKCEEIKGKLPIISEIIRLNERLAEESARLNSIEIDPSLITLDEQLTEKTKKYQAIRDEFNSLKEDVGGIREKGKKLLNVLEEMELEYKQLRETILQNEMENIDLVSDCDEYVIKLQKEFGSNFESMMKKIEDDSKKSNLEVYRIENGICDLMQKYNLKYNVGFDTALSAINLYINKYHKLRDMDIVENKEKTRSAKLKSEESLKTSFISGINEKIENAKKEINLLNKSLANYDFNGEKYEFCISPTSKDNFKEYYEIIQSGRDYDAQSLLSDCLDEGQRKIMDELFRKLSSVDNDKETEKLLQAYTDYRNYLDYDIKIKYTDGTFAYFSKVNREKSGGETQTPFYIIMAASFEQVIERKGPDEDSGCVVILDEAFNNMDEQRIQEMIKLYSSGDIQTIITVPAPRANTIIPFVETKLLIMKQGNQSFVEVITDEEL